MHSGWRKAAALGAIAWALAAGCAREPPGGSPSDPATPSPVGARGSIEVTARLDEIPEGAIFKRDLYDYTTILRYRVLAVHRGELQDSVIHVGHYNPFKPRSKAADRKVPGIGGNVESFRGGDVHRMALEAPLEDRFMGGVIDKYFGEPRGELYWAVWTDAAKAP